MAVSGKVARQELRKMVRGFWDSPTGSAIQDKLREVAIRTIKDGYEGCIKTATTPIKECYRMQAAAANLSGEYRKVWEAP